MSSKMYPEDKISKADEVMSEKQSVYHSAMEGMDHSSLNSHNPGSNSLTTNNFKNSPHNHDKFLKDVFDLIMKDIVHDGLKKTAKIVEYHEPKKLNQLLDLDLTTKGQDHDELLQRIVEVIRYSVKTGHTHFVNQLFSGLDPYGMAAQWVTDALNPSLYTYEVAPVFTLMEMNVIKKMCEIIGFQNGDGLFCPGGAMSNINAVNCARYKLMPSIKITGLFGLNRMIIFTSEHSHYSIKKAAFLLGIGVENVWFVNCDKVGKMVPSHLELKIKEALEQNFLPFFVCATAGTTVLGAFDPLNSLADICEKYGVWFHVDAAWGGGALMSKTHRHLMDGIHRANSVVWNPHKLLGAPQQCSAFLVNDLNILRDCNCAEAQYLFQKDKFYDVTYDVGDKTLQCARKVDVFKFWLMWKAKGTEGFEKHVDVCFDMAVCFLKKISDRPGFKLVLEQPEFTNICFWYIPPSLRQEPDGPELNEKLKTVAPKIKERMMLEGSMMIGYQPLGDWPNFFRLVLHNSATTVEDLDFFIDKIETFGADL